jgi:PIN domain nuclease of toxin-antitoxin system
LKLLLDTHALLWWWLDDAQLSGRARREIQHADNEVWVSAASAWEVATKQRLGKLPGLPSDVCANWSGLLQADGFKALAINTAHALTAGQLATSHRDPFDRMLAAQALLEEATLVSRDPAFESLGCQLIW